MPLELYFKPNEAEETLVFEPLLPGQKRAIRRFVGYDPFPYCAEDDSGGAICFPEEGYLIRSGENVIIPDDWVTEQNNYHEIPEDGRHIEDLTHQEWGEGEFIVIHRRAG